MISKALVTGAYHKKLEEICRLGVDLHLIVPEHWGGLFLETKNGKGYTIYPRRICFPDKNHFHFYPGLEKLVLTIRPEIVHIDEEHYSAVSYQAMRIARKHQVKALFFTWQNIYKNYPFPFSFIEKYNLRNADAAIAGNREAREILVRKGFAKEVYEIPQFGVDPDVFRKMDCEDMRAGLGIKNDEFVIGYLGRLVEEKGIGTILDALRAMAGPGTLLAIGSGPGKPDLERSASSLGAGKRVLLLGRVPSLEVPRYMNCLDCLVLPSRTRANWKEQFGRVLIEAMACEVPVIGSNSGEIPGVIGDAGFVFREGESAELVHYLDDLAKNPSLKREMGAKGRTRVLSMFTQKKIAEATYEVYRRMLSHPGENR